MRTSRAELCGGAQWGKIIYEGALNKNKLIQGQGTPLTWILDQVP